MGFPGHLHQRHLKRKLAEKGAEEPQAGLVGFFPCLRIWNSDVSRERGEKTEFLGLGPLLEQQGRAHSQPVYKRASSAWQPSPPTPEDIAVCARGACEVHVSAVHERV